MAKNLAEKIGSELKSIANPPKNNNGYILHETDTIVVIATGFKSKSMNLKTGAMIQTFILRKDRHPYSAIKDGSDSAVCFDCPFRPSLGNATKCYVKTVHAPAKIWKAYTNGRYAMLPSFDLFNGRKVRFGAYGEPVLIPFQIVREIASRVELHTGYTHQWRNGLFGAYKDYFMASCDDNDHHTAKALGWRAFIVTDGVKRISGSATCPASKEMGKRINCEDCGACSGLKGIGRKDINLASHK